MPSASTKVETPASAEVTDPFKRALTVVDKKVRNLEKRKQKLDSLKQKRDSGAELEKDQQVAVDKYGEVLTNLEFARDLQKQFQSISADVEKLLKKQAKRGKSEKQLQEVKRLKEVLQLQGLLDQLGSETVRKDFQTGKHGAIVLTEDNLEQLDELYKMISPTRDGEGSYLVSLSEASEHIVNLLEAKEKPVAGSTYKELKELLDLISGCGYFEKATSPEEGPKETADNEFEVVEHKDVPAPDSEEVQSSLPPEITSEETDQETVATGQPLLSNDTLNTQPQVIAAQADVFFNTPVTSQTVDQRQAEYASAAAFSQQTRPFQEIVSSVQGNFNFLQESTIEVEAKREFSPHMDPAVVAAHPMPQSQQSMVRPPSNQAPDSSRLQQAGFGGASSFGEQQSTFEQQAGDSDLVSSSHKVSHGASVDQSVFSQAPSQDYTNSGFSQSNLSHTLQTDNLFSGAVSGSESAAANRGMMGKGDNTITHTQYDIPPEIPMPPGHEQPAQDSQQQSDSEKKGFNMNPNATEFQSLIYNQSGDETTDPSNKGSSDGFQGGTYSNTGFNQGPREQRTGSGRGGFRGGRGGNRGGGGMSNGYSRGGGRGGYQGNYQQRDNFRSDGYQGYGGNNYNNGGGFQKRGDGARGGQSRGGNRGGSRGFSRGGSGPGGRGSSRGTGQSYGRPNFNQQQQ